MKKYLLACVLLLSGCVSNYQATTFYVKNNSNKPMTFKASVERYTTAGPYIMSLPFSVAPQDSVLARSAKFRKGLAPNQWFTDFIIFPKDSVVLNDPKNPDNWVKSTDAKGKLVYTFNLAK
ncbi:hypothetical protein GFS24_02880 [Chitinophaga sp. SYP-B3965]|uniref:hypothetical protein n=1 Tax=Chitinophaga sp. SYP-B3965 TaxID=2663120 RepID=UPI001299F6E8|nr:hypothetical protein [Chitinophaga sp. SYP-B3965]MRG44039.1 hypothetical protein [Chitinophaga sp. SYP-B3965]